MPSHCPPGFCLWVPHTLGSQAATHLVIHLLRAVEDVYHGAQGSAQVLGCLGLACASGARRGSTHDQVEGLCERDVAPAKDLQSLGAAWPQGPLHTGFYSVNCGALV